MPTKLKPIHPGKILREGFMVPLRLDAAKLARALRVPISRVADIANERNGISADMARRLARHFGTTVQFWVNLQAGREIAARAYEIFLSRGATDGSDLDDWLQAESEFAARIASTTIVRAANA